MKKLITAIIIILFVVLNTDKIFCTNNSASSNITFYEVPLVCGAAPQIGCGSKAKPILLSFEKKSDVVSEGWLNRSGTVIAIVWVENSSSESRLSTANEIFKENKMDVHALSEKKHNKMVKDFAKKENWYRGIEVDKLSMEEAEIIAERLVERINNKTPLTEDKKIVLKNEFTAFFKKCFSENYGSEINSDESKAIEKFKTNTEIELSNIAQKYLSETEISAFNDAIKEGLRPNENETKKLKGCCSPKK